MEGQEFGVWLAAFIQSQGILIALIVWGIWFVTFRYWPYYTSVKGPADIKNEAEKQKAISLAACALEEMNEAIQDWRATFTQQTLQIPVPVVAQGDTLNRARER